MTTPNETQPSPGVTRMRAIASVREAVKSTSEYQPGWDTRTMWSDGEGWPMSKEAEVVISQSMHDGAEVRTMRHLRSVHANMCEMARTLYVRLARVITERDAARARVAELEALAQQVALVVALDECNDVHEPFMEAFDDMAKMVRALGITPADPLVAAIDAARAPHA